MSIHLPWIILLALSSVIGAWSIKHWEAITAWYYAQTQRLQLLLFVLGALVLITVLMQFTPGA